MWKDLVKDPGFVFGCIGGVYSVLGSQFVYAQGYGQSSSSAYLIFALDLVVFLGLMIAALLQKRRRDGGYLRFAGGVATAMKYFFVIGLFTIVVNHFTFNVIRPSYAIAYAQQAVDVSIEQMEQAKSHLEESDSKTRDAIDQQIQNLRENSFYDLRKAFLHLTLWIGLGLPAALIGSGLLRREPPAKTGASSETESPTVES
jgi:preprotein translocase subunit SecG